MDNMVEFAKRMKAQREKMGLTQAQLGAKIGVSSQTISAYEKNISSDKGKTPTLDKAISIAEVLGVSLDYLCGTAPANQGCKMESLRDIAECLFKISRYVSCYGKSVKRALTDDELEAHCGIPDEYRDEYTKVAVFTLDNSFLAKFFDTKNKLYALYNDGTLSKELYDTIIAGQLAELQQQGVYEHDSFWSDARSIDLRK
jgi:transcriptional regulator with XRE-family HTH domain